MIGGGTENDFTSRASLTPRESEIASLVAGGKSNKEIATDLSLAYSTVKNHISSILDKLNLDHRTQIAIHIFLVRSLRGETQYLLPIDQVTA